MTDIRSRLARSTAWSHRRTSGGRASRGCPGTTRRAADQSADRVAEGWCDRGGLRGLRRRGVLRVVGPRRRACATDAPGPCIRSVREPSRRVDGAARAP